MEFIIPSSTITIVVALLLSAAVMWRVFLDVKDAGRSQKLHDTLLGIGKKQSLKPMTVIVELRETADSIVPLIDHLYSQHYSKLQVIVVVKHTAGKNAVPKLERYRRKYGLKGLRLIRHTRGLTTEQVVQRYATGTFVISLSKDERVSKDFFSILSFDSLLSTDKANITFRRYVALDSTILSSFRAMYHFWPQAMSGRTRSTSSSMACYRKYFINEPKTSKTIQANPRANIRLLKAPATLLPYSRKLIESMSFKPWDHLLALIIFSVAVLTLVVLGLLYPHDIWVLAGVLFLLYTFISTGAYIRARAYSFIDIINLYLIQPFGLLYVAGVYAAALALYVKKKIITLVRLAVTKLRTV